MLVKVTVRVVVRATKIPSEQYLWDTRLKGFGVRVSPSGSVSWILQKRYGGRGGRAIRYVLGNSPSMSLVQARRQAEIDIGEMRKGTHLVDRRRNAREALKTKLTGLTVRQAVERYIKQNTTHSLDHRSRDRLDNRLENLREATDSENSFNVPRRKDNKSGHRGIRVLPAGKRKPRRYVTEIYKDGKKTTLGTFPSLDEALSARLKAANDLFGEFASEVA